MLLFILITCGFWFGWGVGSFDCLCFACFACFGDECLHFLSLMCWMFGLFGMVLRSLFNDCVDWLLDCLLVYV